MDTVHIHRPAGPKISLSCFRFMDPGTVLAYFREGRDKKQRQQCSTETLFIGRDTRGPDLRDTLGEMGRGS